MRYGDGTVTARDITALYVIGIRILTRRAWRALTGR